MKKLTLIGLAVLSLALVGSAGAQELRDAKTATGSTAASVVFGAYNDTVPLVTSYVAKSDLSTATLDIYVKDAVSTLVKTLSAASQATLTVNSTTGFTAATPTTGDYVVIQAPNAADGSIGAVELIKISSITDGTHLLMTSSLAAAQAVNNKVYQMKKIATIPVGAATVSGFGNALGIVGGSKNSPVAAMTTGTSACTVGLVGIQYLAR